MRSIVKIGLNEINQVGGAHQQHNCGYCTKKAVALQMIAEFVISMRCDSLFDYSIDYSSMAKRDYCYQIQHELFGLLALQDK